MAYLLERVQRWGYHTGYASRYILVLDLREDRMARFADDEARQLIAEAQSNNWIAEITRGREASGGPGYVITRKGEAQLQDHRRQAA